MFLMINITNMLQKLQTERGDEINDWFQAQYLKAGRFAPIYSSVDVRNADYKIAPVDTNLFPAGFNNLSEAGIERASIAFAAHLSASGINCQKLVLISENHTRNLPYFANLNAIKRIIENCGIEVRLSRFDLSADEIMDLPLEESTIQFEAMTIKDDALILASGFIPDLVLLNNDLSGGMEEILTQIEQPVLPSPYQGWFARRKSQHFGTYNRLVNDFANQFEIDSWLISTYIHNCGKIDFKERKGMECVALGVDKIIHLLRAKYEEYSIERSPYVYVKADSGTYGMGIMTVRSGDELLELNKKERNKMNVIKEGVKNEEVIIQEGVPTANSFNGDAAEPLVYLIGGEVVDIFWRSNASRDDEISLNAAGMKFDSFAGADFTDANELHLIARLASLAASLEDYNFQNVLSNWK
jgi:glutamate--cysteine ligase